MSDVVRPDPIRWLGYVFTGRVPERSHSWVLHDTTCRTWSLRHVARFLVQLAPLIALVLVFLPAPLPLRLGCIAAGILGTAAFAFGYMVEGAERRVEKAGYRFGTAAKLREQRAMDSQRATAERLRARRTARLARQRAQ